MRHDAITTADSMVAPYLDATPRYTHVGGQRFVPANAAAWREVERWNDWADRWNARTAASRSAAQ